MMGASSSAMHAHSSKRERTEGRHQNQQFVREMSSNSAICDADDKTSQDGQAHSESLDSKSEKEENKKDGPSASFVAISDFGKALSILGLEEHSVKSATNIMKKTKDLKEQLLHALNAVACMKTDSDHVTLKLVEQMNVDFFSVSIENRAIIGEFLKEVTFPLVSFQRYKQVLKGLCQENLNETKLDETDKSEMIWLIRGHWWNYSDCSPSFASSLISHGIVQEAVKDVRNLIGLDEKVIKRSFTFESAIGVLHNVAKIESNRQTFRDLKLVEILGNFLNYEESPKITMLVLLTLALIIDENQTDLLFAHEASFTLIIRLATRAFKSEDHRYDGFSLEELVLGLKGLSKNDKVKRLLVDKGILALVIEILERGEEEEKEITAQLLWELSFDSTNKDMIRNNDAIMTTLATLSKSSGKIARNAQGVLWVLRMDTMNNGKLPVPNKKKKKVNEEKTSDESRMVAESYDTTQGHVMISYNWGDQKQLIQVKESLKQLGFTVWMDIDNISGSTLQAMAEAVEGSSVVLVCMSEKYKESINCRSEAEYAFSLKRPIIPLLMQESYKPDGWLGILLGTKLFFDFSGRFSYDAKISELRKELTGSGISATAGSDQTDGPIIKTTAPLVGKAPTKNQNMTKVDVKAWVLEHQLEKLPLFSSMEAVHLSFLRKLSTKAPEFYYSFMLDLLHKKISIEDLSSLMKATDAIGKLPS